MSQFAVISLTWLKWTNVSPAWVSKIIAHQRRGSEPVTYLDPCLHSIETGRTGSENYLNMPLSGPMLGSELVHSE